MVIFFRQHIAPFLVVLVFFAALVAVSARIFLPGDMAAPAPIEEVTPDQKHAHLPNFLVNPGINGSGNQELSA